MKKNARLNYRDFCLKAYLSGVPNTCNLTGKYFVSLLEPTWKELKMLAMNIEKKMCRFVVRAFTYMYVTNEEFVVTAYLIVKKTVFKLLIDCIVLIYVTACS